MYFVFVSLRLRMDFATNSLPFVKRSDLEERALRYEALYELHFVMIRKANWRKRERALTREIEILGEIEM